MFEICIWSIRKCSCFDRNSGCVIEYVAHCVTTADSHSAVNAHISTWMPQCWFVWRVYVSAYGNKVWVNPSQQKGGFNQQQTSRGSDQWAGRSQDVKSSDFSFSSQNRFSELSNNDNFERGGRQGGGREATVSGEEDDEQKLWVCFLWSTVL